MDDELTLTDTWTLEWLEEVNAKFMEMEEYQGQAVPFQGEEKFIWEDIMEHWRYFMLGYPQQA